jgi:hypothetical protein
MRSEDTNTLTYQVIYPLAQWSEIRACDVDKNI